MKCKFMVGVNDKSSMKGHDHYMGVKTMRIVTNVGDSLDGKVS